MNVPTAPGDPNGNASSSDNPWNPPDMDDDDYGIVNIYGDIIRPPLPLKNPGWRDYINWDTLPEKGVLSKDFFVVYRGVDGSFWNLSGKQAGRQGVIMVNSLEGHMHAPFETKYTGGPYILGEIPNRVDIKKRDIHLNVAINLKSMAYYHTKRSYANQFSYEAVETAWWAAWSRTEDGFLGFFSRAKGWRWLKVRLGADPKQIFDHSPNAFDNNAQIWNMVATAGQPFWHKRMRYETWINPDYEKLNINKDTLKDMEKAIKDGVPFWLNSYTFRILNDGDQPCWPKFLISCPGLAWVQDNNNADKLHKLPLTDISDKYYLLDSDPSARPATGYHDPTDDIILQTIRNIGIIDTLLKPLTRLSLPMWQRLENVWFTDPIPPKTVNNIRVYHLAPHGSITCFVPQIYDKAYG